MTSFTTEDTEEEILGSIPLPLGEGLGVRGEATVKENKSSISVST